MYNILYVYKIYYIIYVNKQNALLYIVLMKSGRIQIISVANSFKTLKHLQFNIFHCFYSNIIYKNTNGLVLYNLNGYIKNLKLIRYYVYVTSLKDPKGYDRIKFKI